MYVKLAIMKVLIIFVLGLVPFSSSEENILCAPSICADVKCADLPEKCKAQNSTHSGSIFPAPTVCNCCEYCLEHLSAGEYCSIGTPSSPSPTKMCGPGLHCRNTDPKSSDGTCSKMRTKCTQKQRDYDKRRAKGLLGQLELRQDCDSDGDFASYKCIPGQTCYCVDKDGNRIFGEADYTGVPEADLKCRCPRDYLQASKTIGKDLNPSEHFRCTANGNYDILQCIGENCFCVDAEDGAPTYPDDPFVNITMLAGSSLTCYNTTTEKGRYYKKCETEYREILDEVNMYKDMGVNYTMGFHYPKCDMDGTYQPVQENSTHKMCVGKDGTPLLAVDKTLYPMSANTMDCKCIRALAIMSAKTERPVCAANGNYEVVQCRRGTCRCVDSDGNQVCDDVNCEVPENELENLQCPST